MHGWPKAIVNNTVIRTCCNSNNKLNLPQQVVKIIFIIFCAKNGLSKSGRGPPLYINITFMFQYQGKNSMTPPLLRPHPLPHQRSRVWNRSRVCVCLSVSQRSHGWTVWAMDLKFGRNIAFDNTLDKFEGQGHRSKVKVDIFKNVIFRLFLIVWPM